MRSNAKRSIYMKKTAVALVICLVVVLTIGLAGCSQGVDKIFGKQEKVSYSLQEVTATILEWLRLDFTTR